MSDMLLLRRRVLMMAGGKPKVMRFYIIRNGVFQNGETVSFFFRNVVSASKTQTRYIAGSGILLSMLGNATAAWPAVRMIINQTYNTDNPGKIGIRLENTGWPTSGSNNRGANLDVTKTRPSGASQTWPRVNGSTANGTYEKIWSTSDINGYQSGNNYLSYWIWGYGNTTTYQTLITDLWLE